MWKQIEHHIDQAQLDVYNNPARIALGGMLTEESALEMQFKINAQHEAAFAAGRLVVTSTTSGKSEYATHFYLPKDASHDERWLSASADAVQIIPLAATKQVTNPNLEAA